MKKRFIIEAFFTNTIHFPRACNARTNLICYWNDSALWIHYYIYAECRQMCELSAVFFFFNLLIALSELIVISEAVVSLLVLSGYDDMI